MPLTNRWCCQTNQLQQRHAEHPGDGEPVAPERLAREHRAGARARSRSRAARGCRPPGGRRPRTGSRTGTWLPPAARDEEGRLRGAVEHRHRRALRSAPAPRAASGPPSRARPSRRSAAATTSARARAWSRSSRSCSARAASSRCRRARRRRCSESMPAFAWSFSGCVARPAGREAAEEDRRRQDRAGRHQQPEGERLDPREGHPPRADHQRARSSSRTARGSRSSSSPSSSCRAARRGSGTGPAGKTCCVRAQQLDADQHRVQAADEEEEADADEVLDADDLVVGAEPEVAADSLRSPSRAATADSRAAARTGSWRSRARSGSRATPKK